MTYRDREFQVHRKTGKRTGPRGLYETFLQLRSPKVLVVDPNDYSREPLASSLRRQGYEVTEMADKNELFAYFGQPIDTLKLDELPELIIADLDIFGGTAHLNMVTYLRKAERTTPVILLASEFDLDGALEASQMGAVYLFKKTSTVEGLLCAAMTLVPL